MAAPAPDLHFEQIYRLHARDVYRFALAVVRNPIEAEDVTQTTFLNAYRALKRGESPERPRSWLFAIAHNAIRSRHRWTMRRPKEVPLENEVHRLSVPEEERANIDEVLKALAELPRNQREALALRELEGLSYGEIATALGVSVTAVESLIARARRTLRLQRGRLRSLVVLQLPQSLRTLLEQGGSEGPGLAAKAAVVIAAVTAVAGGVGVATHESDASRPARPQPAGAFALVPVRSHARAAREAAAPGARAAAAPAPRPRVPRTDDAPGGTPASATPSAPPTQPAPTQPAPTQPVPAQQSPAAGAAAAPAAATAATAVAGTVATTAAVPVVVTTPSVTVPGLTEPVASVPGVTLPAVTVPSVTVTAPVLPAPPPIPTPQGTLPSGIK
jgi:RNA polymerase sigma-70 factor (ECF subfamily)